MPTDTFPPPPPDPHSSSPFFALKMTFQEKPVSAYVTINDVSSLEQLCFLFYSMGHDPWN